MKEFPWEDGLLERKVESDLKDLLKTIVAFANSVRPGHQAVILIGEKDDGSVQGVNNPDSIQMSVRKECEKVYPDINWRSAIYEKDSKHCVRVEIEYSGNTPHFAGPAYVRSGSSSVKASDTVFQKLIDIRTDSVFELAKWIDKTVTIHQELPGHINGRWPKEIMVVLKSVNRHWATFEEERNVMREGMVDKRLRSEPIEKLILTYDNERQQLKLLVKA